MKVQTSGVRTLDGQMAGVAVFSPDGTHRYSLTRRWAPGPVIVWAMLNPSTADAFTDDQTIGRCTGYSAAWGYGGLTVVNLFAFRSTDPAVLRQVPAWYAVGRHNDKVIGRICRPRREPRTVVAAWGAHGRLHDRGREVATRLAGLGVRLQCIGLTNQGQPVHPSRQPAAAQLQPFDPRDIA